MDKEENMLCTSKNQNPQTSTSNPGFTVRRISGMRGSLLKMYGLLAFTGASLAVASAVLLTGCMVGGEREFGKTQGSKIESGGAWLDFVDEVRYPTTAADFADSNLLYGNRDFLSTYQGIFHLGRDIIYRVGEPIHPIAPGKIVFYGPANGYGSLVVAIEHKLAEPMQVINGDGQMVTIDRFISIYGHGSKHDPTGVGQGLLLSAGQVVEPSDVIMYIQNDHENGDGTPHLHLGIRLQSYAQAIQTEPKYWLRGNDNSNGDFKKYYTAPKTFIPALAEHVGFALHVNAPSQSIVNHPIGTLLHDEQNATDWLVVEEGQILNVTSYTHLPRHCMINASQEELSCYKQAAFHQLGTVLDAQVIKFEGRPEVYRFYPGAGFQATGYQVFLSYESFLSWGYTDSDILLFPASEKQELVSALKNEGGVGMMPGALVSSWDESEVSVASQHGTRRPILDWETFQAMGFNPDCVFQVDPTTLDVVAGARVGDMITVPDAQVCLSGQGSKICTPGEVLPCDCGGITGSQACLDDGKSYGPCVCEPGPGGGVGGSGGSAGTNDCVDGQVRDCSEHCDEGFIGTEMCTQGLWSNTCYCNPDSSGTGGSAGSTGTGGSGGSSGTGGSSGGTGGASGASGTGGTGGSGFDLVSITLVYQGPNWTMPVLEGEWGSRPYGALTGCTQLAAGYAECTFDVPEAVLDSLRWQVNLGMNRYWGDTSGISPAPCVPQNQLASYCGTSVTVIGTVSLKLDGAPTEFGLCSNGIANPNYSNICGESPFPYMNGCLNP